MRIPQRARRARGFSVVEGLIAAGILLIIAVGILPLFTRAMLSNVSGDESTKVSNYAKSGVEDYLQRPYNDLTSMTIAKGEFEFNNPQETFIDPNTATTGDERWVLTSAVTAGQVPLWRRDIRIRQFGISSFRNKDKKFDEAGALDGDTDSEFVHLKEIRTTVASTRTAANPLGGNRTLVLRTFRSQ